MRRVLGDRQPQGWIDMHFSRPEPDLPTVQGDKLFSFVAHHLGGWESQVAIEAREYQDGPHAAAILRWALDIRRQCAAMRLVLVQYAEARDKGAHELPSLRRTLDALATTWRTAHDWRESWD